MSWREYGDWAFYGCAISAVLFAMLYLFFAPWWETKAGRNIMAVMGSLAVALAYFAWVITIGGVPSYFWPTRAILFTGIAVAISWRIVIFIQLHMMRSLRDPREGKRNVLEDTREVDRHLAGDSGDGGSHGVPSGGS